MKTRTSGDFALVSVGLGVGLAVGFVAGHYNAHSALMQCDAESSSSSPTQTPRRLSATTLSEQNRNNRSLLARILGFEDWMLRELAEEIAAWPLEELSLMKKGHSASWLQEAFVRLHQILFQRKLLPLSGFGEYLAHTPRGRGAFDKTSISRRAFVLFIRRESERVRRNAICLGWDSQKHLPPRCDQWRSWSFVFQAGVPRVATGRVLHADLTKLESGAPAGVPSFDLIVCNEVLEHVPDPFAATRSLYALLKPGGLVIFTAPFACRQHLGWDFFRYTVSGAAQIFSQAGFKVLLQQRVGNTYLASGFVLGFGSGDFPERWTHSETASDLLFHNVSNSTSNDPQEWLYISTAAVLQRPLIHSLSSLAAGFEPMPSDSRAAHILQPTSNATATRLQKARPV